MGVAGGGGGAGGTRSGRHNLAGEDSGLNILGEVCGREQIVSSKTQRGRSYDENIARRQQKSAKGLEPPL